MRRRIFRGTFWVGILACTLPMAGAMSALSPPGGAANIEGAWDGFYQSADGATGMVGSNITHLKPPRVAGEGTLFDLENGDVSYDLEATMAQPYFITGTGAASNGRMTFQADLENFNGLGGDAGVMSAKYRFVPSRGGANTVEALLLRPFPGVATPDISGNGRGPFASFPDPNIPGDVADPSFTGVGQVQISPINERGMFAGRVDFRRAANQPPIFSWPLLATTSDNGRIIMISQGATGRIVYDGVVVPPSTPEQQTFVGGFFRLRFFDGGSLYGAINFNLSRPVIN